MAQEIRFSNHTLEPTVRVLRQLSPQSQEAVIALVKQLSDTTLRMWYDLEVDEDPD